MANCTVLDLGFSCEVNALGVVLTWDASIASMAFLLQTKFIGVMGPNAFRDQHRGTESLVGIKFLGEDVRASVSSFANFAL